MTTQHRWTGSNCWVAIAGVLAWGSLASALSFTGTVSAASTPSSPISTGVELCNTAPRSPEATARLLNGPAIATPAATTGGNTLPEGRPADSAMRQAIAKTVEQWLACENAGEPLRAWALFSDGYLYRLLSRQAGTTEPSLRALATPAPVSEATAELQEIRDERILPDGRLGATAVLTYKSVPMPKTFFFYFTEEQDHLVIDGILGEISFSVP